MRLPDAEVDASGLLDADTEPVTDVEPLSVGAAVLVVEKEALGEPVLLAVSVGAVLGVAGRVTRRDSLALIVGEKEGVGEVAPVSV